MRYVRILLVLLLAASISCEMSDVINLDFSQPEVESSSPTNRQTDVQADSLVTVQFSKSMDTLKTNDEFSLSTTEGRVSGNFTWDDSDHRMIFHPAESLKGGLMYTLSITTAAEDTEGNDLKYPYCAVFYVNGDITPPRILSHVPQRNGVMADPTQNITITFDEAIDADTLYSGISITPAVEATFSLDVPTQSVLTIDPTYRLDYSTTYTVTVTTAIRDINRNPLERDYAFSFTVGNDFTHPTIQSVDQPAVKFEAPNSVAVTNGVDKNQDIIITFSEPVKSSTLQGALSFTPAADFYVLPEGSAARIRFREPLESETHYTMKVSQSITDMNDNQLDKVYQYYFVTNGYYSVRPVVESVTAYDTMADLSGVYGDPVLLRKGYIEILGVDKYNRFMITFSRAMDPESIVVNVTSEVGIGSPTPVVINPDWNDDFTEYTFDLSTVNAGYTYKITAEGDTVTRDAWRNYLKDDEVRLIEY